MLSSGESWRVISGVTSLGRHRKPAGALLEWGGVAPELAAGAARPDLAGVASWKAPRAALCIWRLLSAEVGDATSGTAAHNLITKADLLLLQR